jgi:hypothetical protein
MCANQFKLWMYPQVENWCTWNPVYNSRTEKYDTLFCELSPATHSFLLLTDNFWGLNEAGHVVTTRFHTLLWPQVGCLILGNYLMIGSFTLCMRWIYESENVCQPMRPNTCPAPPCLEKHCTYHFHFNLSRWLLIEKKKLFPIYANRSRDSSVGIVSTLQAGRSFPGRVSRFLLSTPKRTDRLWGPPWLSVGTGGSFIGRKAARLWSYLPLSSAEVKNEWSCTATHSRNHHNLRRDIMLEALRAQMWRGAILYCSCPFIVLLFYIYCIVLVHLSYCFCTFIVLLLYIYLLLLYIYYIAFVHLLYCSCTFIVLLLYIYCTALVIYCTAIVHLFYCYCTFIVLLLYIYCIAVVHLLYFACVFILLLL